MHCVKRRQHKTMGEGGRSRRRGPGEVRERRRCAGGRGKCQRVRPAKLKAATASASKSQEKSIEFKKNCFKFDWPVAWVAATGAVDRRRGFIVKVKAAMV